MGVPVDSSNCGGEDGKKGGTIGGRCYEFIMDPSRRRGVGEYSRPSRARVLPDPGIYL